MIRHILKIIWNERRSNLWILLEYTLVFSVLWFCCDYCSAILRTYKSDPGIDIRDTYRIEMGYRIIKNTDEPEPEYDRFALTMTFLERVKRHPDVAYVALGRYAIPYSGSVATSGWMLNDEKGLCPILRKSVSGKDWLLPIFSGYSIFRSVPDACSGGPMTVKTRMSLSRQSVREFAALGKKDFRSTKYAHCPNVSPAGTRM